MIIPVPYPSGEIGLAPGAAAAPCSSARDGARGRLYSKYFFFLFGIAYVGYGLLRAVLLGLVERGNGTEPPRRRADDYDRPPDFPPPVGADAVAVEPDDVEYFDDAPEPAAHPTADLADADADDGVGAPPPPAASAAVPRATAAPPNPAPSSETIRIARFRVARPHHPPRGLLAPM